MFGAHLPTDLKHLDPRVRRRARQLQRGGDGACHSVISCDPIYRFSTGQIRERIRDTTEVILDQARPQSA